LLVELIIISSPSSSKGSFLSNQLFEKDVEKEIIFLCVIFVSRFILKEFLDSEMEEEGEGDEERLRRKYEISTTTNHQSEDHSEEEEKEKETMSLHDQLRKVDPLMADHLHPNNTRLKQMKWKCISLFRILFLKNTLKIITKREEIC